MPTSSVKPYSEWTLSEARDYCKSRDGKCEGCVFSQRVKMDLTNLVEFACLLGHFPVDWDIPLQRLTEQEINDLNTIIHLISDAISICRTTDYLIVVRSNKKLHDVTIDYKLFPSIMVGKHIIISDYMKDS